jgi:hypothetical protein
MRTTASIRGDLSNRNRAVRSRLGPTSRIGPIGLIERIHNSAVEAFATLLPSLHNLSFHMVGDASVGSQRKLAEIKLRLVTLGV